MYVPIQFKTSKKNNMNQWSYLAPAEAAVGVEGSALLDTMLNGMEGRVFWRKKGFENVENDENVKNPASVLENPFVFVFGRALQFEFGTPLS